MCFVSRSLVWLFWSLLASVTVLQVKRINPTSGEHSAIIPRNETRCTPFICSKFLEQWKKLYIAQKEILLLISQHTSPSMLQQNNAPKHFDLYNYFIDICLFQLMNLENIRSKAHNWKMQESMMKYVRKVIHRNQNPKNCRNIEVIAYDPKSICGFGCQIHHLAYCLMVALGEGKPLVVKTSPWNEFGSIFDVIMPLSQTCHYGMIKTNHLKVKYIEVEDEFPKKEILPRAFRKYMMEKIEEFHTDPFLWYISQIIIYIMRLRPNTWKIIQPMKLKSPIVGVHVRRTDYMLTEAKSYPIEEYMKYVQLYFRKHETTSKISTKSVYLATDDQQIIAEFRNK
ncbi:Alpha-(1,6)-fucosyltransferase [Thelohanellus kitauei]|uniref:Alpha-(1,6)-fucosyltransferase n=1 Tax=Thelohanellus kitauei TaxID=669202 RepID=A0A0C2ITP6_THEKT|nr:Alpha-(1,6)-fucosyltransferase [Thelohanellus kitauei]